MLSGVGDYCNLTILTNDSVISEGKGSVIYQVLVLPVVR